MITHFLGDAEVDAYLRDLIARLNNGTDRPRVWIPIGKSGRILVQRILGLKEAESLLDTTIIVPAAHDRAAEAVHLDEDSRAAIKGNHVLVLDGAVHSGMTMLRVVRETLKFEPLSVDTYSLVLKRSSMFVPSLWAMTMDDHDRAYFLLEELPNNRLVKAGGPRGVYIRKLEEVDLDVLPAVPSGLDSMDRITWADRWYDMRRSNKHRCTYLLMAGQTVVAYLTVASDVRGEVLTVDEVATDTTQSNKGYAGTLMRWAETAARQSGISTLELWGVDEAVPMYKKLHYIPVDGEKPMRLDGHDYLLMRKRLVYHSGTKHQFL